jgi:hypothetical protein
MGPRSIPLSRFSLRPFVGWRNTQKKRGVQTPLFDSKSFLAGVFKEGF